MAFKVTVEEVGPGSLFLYSIPVWIMVDIVGVIGTA